MSGSEPGPEWKGQMESERAFEDYLLQHGYKDFRYEEEVEKIAARVDYSFEVEGKAVRCDAKEWEPEKAVTGFGSFDMYGPIRAKIKKGQEKFKEYKGRGECCCLVLAHFGPQLIILDFTSIYGAMLGDFGLQFPVATSGNVAIEAKHTEGFIGTGGKMLHRHKPGTFGREVNTTISAIIVPGFFDVFYRQLGIAVRRHELEKGIKDDELSPKEHFVLACEIAKGMPEYPPQRAIQVYDNPFAREPLPRSFPAGLYDERYGRNDDELVRLFAGAKILELEKAEKALGME